MAENTRVLVVGTTPDYILWIQQVAPDRAVFVTDQALRETAAEPPPPDEVLYDPDDEDGLRDAIRRLLRDRRFTLNGLVCYDCDSMELAALLARDFNLPFPSIEAIRTCRNKEAQKQAWRQDGVPCPSSEVIRLSGAGPIPRSRMAPPVVVKPVKGSGSELVFLCQATGDRDRALERIGLGIQNRQGGHRSGAGGAETSLALEEAYCAGEEFSCDFLIDQGQVAVIRVARKIKSPAFPFGTILGYELSPGTYREIATPAFIALLKRAAEALGIQRSICMVDFVMGDQGPCFLELSPRPGGDCLPTLIQQSVGLDIRKFALDFAAGRATPCPDPEQFKPLVGLRLLINRPGELTGWDVRAVETDARVQGIEIKRQIGHHVRVPPEDYDSWLLGHLYFKPHSRTSLQAQCEGFLNRMSIVLD